MYFDSFPKIFYDSVGQGNPKVVTNLLRRVAIRAKVKTNKLYKDPELHWIGMLVNNITDRYHQWPMKEQQFNTYLNEKYDNPDGVHHYEISQESGDTSTKIEVYANEALYTGDTDFYNSATTITNREYEEREQDKKRQIRLLDPRYVDEFVDEFDGLIGESII